jgi:hypothetical protein
MANEPALFAMDYDLEVLRGVERDLLREYGRSRNGDSYRIRRAEPATVTIDTRVRSPSSPANSRRVWPPSESTQRECRTSAQ